MKNYSLLPVKLVLYALLVLLISINVNAQKLPALQKESLYAPANIKIDGKATEWDNKFQAYNAANSIFYTLSNDDKNLYLVVFTSENEALSKIIYGGITLTVTDAANK